MSFLNSIQNKSQKHEFPFDHWEYNNALSEEAISEIINADIPDVSEHNLSYDGTRAIAGGAAEEVAEIEDVGLRLRLVFWSVALENVFNERIEIFLCGKWPVDMKLEIHLSE